MADKYTPGLQFQDWTSVPSLSSALSGGSLGGFILGSGLETLFGDSFNNFQKGFDDYKRKRSGMETPVEGSKPPVVDAQPAPVAPVTPTFGPSPVAPIVGPTTNQIQDTDGNGIPDVMEVRNIFGGLK
jgi:hypothetical protein